MHISIVTLFPEFFDSPLQAGLMGKARDAGILAVTLHNPRNESTDRHKTVDARPYGGGPGMVMMLDPLVRTLRSLGFKSPGENQPGRLLFMTPAGRPFTQAFAQELSAEKNITILCGRYEGIDARLADLFPVEGVCLGDYVLNGGESAALSVIEATGRLLPGFMGHEESGTDESFSSGLLEYPHYTRPETYESLPVPDMLRSGDHARIATWRRQQSLASTLSLRPEMLSDTPLSADDQEFLRMIPQPRLGKNLYCALVHYPVLDKDKKSVAVSLTNLDIHDIARSSCTYGLGGYYITTPLEDQRKLLRTLTGHWLQGAGAAANSDRAESFSLVREAASVDEAAADITARTGQMPFVTATSAKSGSSMGFSALRKVLAERPVLLLFGTGQGLAPSVIDRCDAILPPLRWHSGYNHLSVRSAAAIMMDRILGDWQ